MRDVYINICVNWLNGIKKKKRKKKLKEKEIRYSITIRDCCILTRDIESNSTGYPCESSFFFSLVICLYIYISLYIYKIRIISSSKKHAVADGGRWSTNQPLLTRVSLIHVTERWRARARRSFARARAYTRLYRIGGLRNQKVRSLLDVPSMIPA